MSCILAIPMVLHRLLVSVSNRCELINQIMLCPSQIGKNNMYLEYYV
uniref:Uncharacterized protein n=1 Tax=Anguilla anguilla TaxID=7936 RepID=A0A0E9T7T7_ANGAN